MFIFLSGILLINIVNIKFNYLSTYTILIYVKVITIV